MTKEEMIALLKTGEVSKWNAWRANHPEVKIDLCEAGLSWANLRQDQQDLIVQALLASWKR